MDRSTVVAQTETVTKRWAYELGHMPILYGPGHAWHGKDGIMAGGTSSTAITAASGRLISVVCLSEGSSLSSGSHSGSFPDHHKSSTKMK